MLDTSSVQYFFGGWLVILVTIWVMSKFEGTKTLLYYLFWLGIVLDIVVHYDILVSYFATLGFIQPTTIEDFIGVTEGVTQEKTTDPNKQIMQQKFRQF